MQRRVVIGAALTVLVLAGAAVGASRAAERSARERAAARVDAERQAREADIAFYRERVARDPIGAADRTQLAALHLQRARETGNYQDVLRAEELARQSLALRTGHNAKSYSLLAAALLAQHRFADALEIGRALHHWDPQATSFHAQLAEIELELGNYDAAQAAFDSLWPRRRELAVAPRLARWAEIQGRTQLARRLLDEALTEALARTELPREQLAWYYWRAGDLALRTGRLDEARFAFDQGLEVFPGDYRLLVALAKLEAAQGHWHRAIDYGEQAIATVADPATLGLLSDAHATLGDADHAAQYARAMELSVTAQPGQWHRAWSLFLLDHDRRVPEVLAKVQDELQTRRDVYGYDLLAWALHKGGRDAEAWEAMARALSQGTRDPQLLDHAREIARSLSHSAP
ncbi:MAG: tetratricopeptide repeat protein [Gemmatimonadetes bacterium]|nr:tetratricopeptide repeat protein [Gemmatimonadota bacterium]